MTRRIIAAFILSCTLILRIEASSAQTSGTLSIILKAKPLVFGPKILLGEVGVIEGADNEVKAVLDSLILGQAPPPGESRELTLSYIKTKLRAAGLKKYIQYIRGPKTIRVTTAHVQIDKAILRDAVTDFIENRLPRSVVRHEIEFRRLPESVSLGRYPDEIKVELLGSKDVRGFKSCWVELNSAGRRITRVPVALFVRTFENALIAKERIDHRQALSVALFRKELAETTGLSAPPLAPEAVEGKRARRIISPGEILTGAVCESPPLVERGQVVTLIAQSGEVRVCTAARAQQTGDQSDRIRVRNLKSGKVLRAVVVAEGTVEVEH